MKSLLLIFLLVFSHSLTAQNIAQEWRKVLRSCGATQIIGKQIIFFGPSNTIGIGSVWRKTDQKGYNPRFELSDLILDPTARASVIIPGVKQAKCDVNKKTIWDTNISIPFVSSFLDLSGLGLDFHSAKRTTVSVSDIALDVLKELKYEKLIKEIIKNDPQNLFLQDLLIKDRLLVTKAYRITGMVVKQDYDPKQLEDLKVKYPSGGSINLGGEKGIKVEFSYGKESELTIKLPTEVYIAGEYSRISNSGDIKLSNGPSEFRIILTAASVDPQPVVGKLESPLSKK